MKRKRWHPIRFLVAAGALMVPCGGMAAQEAEDCLARAVFFEARDDGAEGMAAVATVVINRVRHPEFPDDVCAVVHDGGEEPGCQFSYWCDGESDQPDEGEEWTLAQEVAKRVLDGEESPPVEDALFFHADDVEPSFHETREQVGRVGSQVFYR